MAGLHNGLVDLSQPISNIEIALQNYAYHPRRGLEQLQSALLFLQEASQSRVSHHTYHQRLYSFITAIDELLLSGSPYFSHYHSAFLSASDALFQVAMAGLFSADRSQQLDHLLASDRSCWVLMTAISSEKNNGVIYRNYEARLDSTQTNVTSVDAYLEAFSSAGRVSFQLDSVKDSRLNGRFSLVSVQSLSWLKRRFPSLQWQVLSVNEKEPLRALCELSYLPLFQNVTMSRDSRYRLLSLFEDRFKALFYQVFSSLFPLSLTNVDQAERLVPNVNHVSTFEPDEQLAYLPVRYGGYVYVGSRTLSEGSVGSYVKCLGRDYLSYFMYEVDTSFGRFAFDQQECWGRFDIGPRDVFLEGGTVWFQPEEGVRAKVLLNMSLFSGQVSAPYCLLMESITHVLVVQQGECFFALPCHSIREMEAVSSAMSTPRSWVKNIWLSQTGEAIFEPWLLEGSAFLPSGVWPEKNKSAHPSKNGYYFGSVHGRVFWVEAELILSLLPYKLASTVAYFDKDALRVMPFFIHEGRSFDKVMSDVDLSGDQGSFDDKVTFSVILEWMSESIVLPFTSCEWSATLTSTQCVDEFSLPTDKVVNGCESIKSQLASLPEGDLVINKKNFLSFVAGFWPSSLA